MIPRVATRDEYLPGLNDNTGVAPIDPLAGKLPAVTWPDHLFPNSLTICEPGSACSQERQMLQQYFPRCDDTPTRQLLHHRTVNIDHLRGDNVFLYPRE